MSKRVVSLMMTLSLLCVADVEGQKMPAYDLALGLGDSSQTRISASSCPVKVTYPVTLNNQTTRSRPARSALSPLAGVTTTPMATIEALVRYQGNIIASDTVRARAPLPGQTSTVGTIEYVRPCYELPTTTNELLNPTYKQFVVTVSYGGDPQPANNLETFSVRTGYIDVNTFAFR